MDKDSKKVSLLRAVYFDSDVLRSMDFNLHEDPALSEFKARIESVDAGLFVPQIVFDEVLVGRTEELKRYYDQVTQAYSKLSRMLGKDGKQCVQSYGELLSELKIKYQANMSAAGLVVFDTPYSVLDLKDLVEMAVTRVKPFASEGKGFKDAIILLSSIHHSKSLHGSSLFVTNNKKDFDDAAITKLIESFQCPMHVCFGIEEAKKYVAKTIDAIVQSIFQKRETSLRSFLDEHRNEIADYINQVGFSDSFLSDGHWNSSVEQVKNIRVVGIEEPNASFLPAGESEGQVSLSFKARVRISYVLKRVSYESPKHRVTALPIQEPVSERIENLPVITIKTVTITGSIKEVRHDDTYSFSSLAMNGVHEHGIHGAVAQLLQQRKSEEEGWT